MTKCPIRHRKSAAVVDRAQGLQTPWSTWYQAIFALGFCFFEKSVQKLTGHSGQVAGDQKIPVGASILKCGEQSSQRTRVGRKVGQNGQSKAAITLGSTYQSHIPTSLVNRPCNGLNKGRAVPGEQGFVASHAGALATGQNPTGPLDSIPTHEMIVPASGIKQWFKLGPVSLRNKKVYSCFVLVLAASPMRASEPISVSQPAPPPPAMTKITYVVRVDPRTGRLVRTVVQAPGVTKPRSAQKASPQIAALVQETAKAHQVDPLLVGSVIEVESNYNQYAVSPKGAEGLMQLMPETARMLGVRNSFDARENIEAGVRYLKTLQEQYKDNRLALAAYNAGPGAVDKYKWVPPFPETRKYVDEVGRRYEEARAAEAVKTPVAKPSPEPVLPVREDENRHPRLEQFVDQDGRLHLRTAN